MPLRAILPILGSLPFLAGSLLLLAGVDNVLWLGNTSDALSIYGLVIAAFMAGCHWGMALNMDGRYSLLLPLASNVVAIFLWLGYLVLAPNYYLLGLAIALAAILFVDFLLYRDELITTAYWRIRLWVTVTVCIALVLAIYAVANRL